MRQAVHGCQQGVLSSAAVWTGWLLLITALHCQRFDLSQMQTAYWLGACNAFPALALWQLALC